MKWLLSSVLKISVSSSLYHYNLTNKFKPLDITFIKQAKSFIKGKYNIWYTEQVTKQLNEGEDPANVEVLLNLFQVKPRHAK